MTKTEPTYTKLAREAQRPTWGFPKIRGTILGGYRDITPIMENQMEKKWKMKWKLGIYGGIMGFRVSLN